MFFLECNLYGLEPIIGMLYNGLRLILIFIPLLLILFGVLDLAKAVMAGKEDEMKKFQTTLIRRFIYAAAAFLIVFLVTVLTNFLSTTDTDDSPAADSWYECWANAANGVYD